MDRLLNKDQIRMISGLQMKMKKVLKESRYRHTVSVAHTAASLAMVYDAPLFKTMAAGILHDCAKCYSDDELLKKCRKKGLEIREAEAKNPSLLHAKYGAFLAKDLYGVEDEEILSAIECHTTGKPGMSILDKIIFTADYIEPYRVHSDKLPDIRRLAFLDIDRAMGVMLNEILTYLSGTGDIIDEMTRMTFEEYRSLCSGQDLPIVSNDL